MEFRLLGPLEVAERERSLALGGAQAALAAGGPAAARERGRLGRPADRRAVGRAPPATAAKSIQVYVSRLRKELGAGPARHPRRPATCSRVEPRRARPRPLRAAASARRGSARSASAPREAARGAGAVARAAARRPGLRAVRADRDRAPGGAALGRARGADRRRSRRRPPRGRWSASSRRWSPSIRCASACAAS